VFDLNPLLKAPQEERLVGLFNKSSECVIQELNGTPHSGVYILRVVNSMQQKPFWEASIRQLVKKIPPFMDPKGLFSC